jgi:hypothetical protein
MNPIDKEKPLILNTEEFELWPRERGLFSPHPFLTVVNQQSHPALTWLSPQIHPRCPVCAMNTIACLTPHFNKYMNLLSQNWWARLQVKLAAIAGKSVNLSHLYLGKNGKTNLA